MIRPFEPDDFPFLADMLYEAGGGAYKPNFEQEFPRAGLLESAFYARYLGGWGRPGDNGLVATDDAGAPVGAAWYRLHDSRESPGGQVAPSIPVLSIAVVKEQRGRGYGTQLLAALFDLAYQDGFHHLSLGVFRENWRARDLYERVGFRIQADMGTHFKMLRKLDPPPESALMFTGNDLILPADA